MNNCSIGEFDLTKKNMYIEVPTDTNLSKQIMHTLTTYHMFAHTVARIRWIVNTKDHAKYKDKSSFMKIKKISDLDSLLMDCDYLIVINYSFYQQIDQSKQVALLDDILSRIDITENESTGEIKFGLQNPDIIEFSEVIKHHGAYMENVKLFLKELTKKESVVNEK